MCLARIESGETETTVKKTMQFIVFFTHFSVALRVIM